MLSLGLIVVLACFNLWFIKRHVETKRSQSQMVNLLGRQRMRGQSVCKAALYRAAFAEPGREPTVNPAKEIAAWMAMQRYLQVGNAAYNIEPASDIELIKLLEQGGLLQQKIGLAVTRLRQARTDSEGRETAARLLMDATDAYLAVTERSQDRLLTVQAEELRIIFLWQYCLLALTILCVIAEGLFIFRPLAKKTVRAVARLSAATNAQKRALRKMQQLREREVEYLATIASSEQRYRQLVEGSSDLIYKVNYSGSFLYGNYTMRERFALTQLELDSISYMSLVRPDYRERVATYYKNLAKEGAPHSYFEFPIVSRYGQEIWLGQTGHTTYTDDGKVEEIQFIARDLTELRALQHERDAQQTLLQTVLASGTDGVIACKYGAHQEGEAAYLEVELINPAACRILKVEALAAMHKRLLKLLPKQIAPALGEWLNEAGQSRHPRKRVVELTGEEGLRHWECRAMATPTGMVLTITDITLEREAKTELERQHAFYANILDNLPTDVAVFGPDHRYRYLNPKAIQNPETRRWIIGKDDYDYCEHKNRPVDLANNRRRLFMQCVELQKPINWDEQSGAETHTRWFIPIRNASGQVTMVIGHGLDITERKQLERERAQAQEQALQSAQARQMFLSTMSHEMRTPLNAVIGLSHLLLAENPRQDQAENLNTIIFSATNLLALINDVLDIGKLEAGKVLLELVPVNLPDLIVRVHALFKHQAEGKAIAFTIDVDPTLPVNVCADPTRLTQILTNLVSNAIKFTDEGGVCIRVERQGADAHGHIVKFSVQDTGIGIADDKHEHIFDSFTQADSDITRRFGGTGLGLAISRKLVGLFGGWLTVASTPGQGSTFSFSVSLAAVEPPLESVKEVGSNLPTSLDGMSLLLVEDNDMNRLVATKFLKRWGIVPDIAENGIEAIAHAENRFYDVVLMDLQMPEMDGFEATKILRNAGYASPIIALTAGTEDEVREQVLDAGMDGFLTKPFDPEVLFDRLSAYFRH